MCVCVVFGAPESIGTYRDLVGVLFSNLLDFFAAISCGKELNVNFRTKCQSPQSSHNDVTGFSHQPLRPQRSHDQRR